MNSPVRSKRSFEHYQSRTNRVASFQSASTEAARSQRRSKFLDDRYWKPYRNSDHLAQQLYDLTHPIGEKTLVGLDREAAVAETLKPY